MLEQLLPVPSGMDGPVGVGKVEYPPWVRAVPQARGGHGGTSWQSA